MPSTRVSGQVGLIGVELVVPDLDAALTLLLDALGLDMVDRRHSDDPVGEVAVLAGEGACVTLLEPAATGPGRLLPDRQPRLAQLLFGAPRRAIAQLAAAVTEQGIPVQVLDDDRVLIPPDAVEGLVGVRTALVVTPIDPPPDPLTASEG